MIETYLANENVIKRTCKTCGHEYCYGTPKTEGGVLYRLNGEKKAFIELQNINASTLVYTPGHYTKRNVPVFACPKCGTVSISVSDD